METPVQHTPNELALLGAQKVRSIKNKELSEFELTALLELNKKYQRKLPELIVGHLDSKEI